MACRGWWAVGVLAGALVLTGWCAPAGLTSPLTFGAAVRADDQGLVSLSCPSARLCVGVDASGRIVSSTRPTGDGAGWRVQMISGPGGPVQLREVSCPSTGLCVAIGTGDNVASSTDPGASGSQWRLTQVTESSPSVDPDESLGGIDCPTVSLCVGTDEQGDVITSIDAASSQPAWTASHVDDATTYECIHYDQTGCPPDLGPVSCPSVSRCVAMDFEGNELTASDPTAGAGAWQPIGGYASPDTFWGYLTCVQSMCLTAQSYDAGIYAQSSTEPRPAAPVFTVSGSVSALACPSGSLCLAGNSADHGPARVYISTAPQTRAWRTVYLAAPGLTGETTISAISCPSTRLCFVADDAGRVVAGTPGPTQTQLMTALRKLIRLRGAQASTRHILRHHGFRKTLTAPLTGSLTITWRPRRADNDQTRRRIGPVLASAATHLIKDHRAAVLIKLTPAGRQALSHTTDRLALIASARLASASQPSITVTTTITLKPR